MIDPRRFLFPVALATPLVLWGLKSFGQEVGIWSGTVADALFTLLTMAVFALAFLRAARDCGHRETGLQEAATRYHTLFDQSPDGIVITDPKTTRPLIFNATVCRQLGYTTEEFATLRIADYEILESPQEVEAHIKRILRDGRDEFTTRHRTKQGEIRDVQVVVQTVLLDGKTVFQCVYHDITAHREHEAHQRLLEKVFENGGEAIVVTDQANKILSVNRAFTEITGYSPIEAIGQNPKFLQSGRQGPEFYQTLWHTLLTTGHWQGEIWNRRKNGETYPEWLTISVIKDKQGKVAQHIGIFSDVTTYKRQEEQIRHQAFHDALTGLPNRALFIDRLTLALAQAHRSRTQLAVMLLDLDRFKQINDSLGHYVGDLLLQEVARRLRGAIREYDTVARLGGDEFTMLLPCINDTQEVTTFVDKILSLFKAPCLIQDNELFTSPSIGVALYPYDGMDADSLLKNADTAMYLAKRGGRNSYQIYSPEMNANAAERLHLENRLRRAIDRDEFLLYYQPQVDAITGKVTGIEALLRWQHPDMGLLFPKDFIHLAEHSGLIVPIGEWVLRTACLQNKSWQGMDYQPVPMAVNISPKQLRHPNIVRIIKEALKDSGLEGRWLNLELTESILLQEGEISIERLHELKSLGLTLVIDDFGTGYSSLIYLKRLPLDIIKIDHHFVQGMVSDLCGSAITNAIITMAHALEFTVVAEGVESQCQMELLRDQHCDEIQGYYTGQPLLPEALTEMLRTNHSGPLNDPSRK
jgi:diguanylate cyclase (GGDEF)-like protein/PAS domain S-box-containing protein